MTLRVRTLVAPILIFCAGAARGLPSFLGMPSPVDPPISSPALRDQSQAGIAFGGNRYLVVWRDSVMTDQNSSINGALLDATGALVQGVSVATSAVSEGNPAVAYDGKNFVVVWDSRGANDQDVHAQRFDANGAKVGAEMVLGGGPPNQGAAAVASGGGHTLVTWTGGSLAGTSVFGQILDDTGALVGGVTTISNATDRGGAQSVVWGGANGFLVAWESVVGFTAPVIAGAIVDQNGVASAPFTISTSMNGAQDVAVASDGTSFFALWTEFDGGFGGFDLWERLISGAGAPQGMPTLAAMSPGGDGEPQLIAAGGSYVGVWERIDLNSGLASLAGGRFDATGLPLDGQGILLSTDPPSDQTGMLPSDQDGRRTAVATDGTLLLTAWSSFLAGPSGYDAYALPTALQAFVPASSTALSVETNTERTPAVASNGDEFLVVWDDSRDIGTSGVDLFARRFDSSWTPIDAAAFPVCTHAGDQILPSVAALPNGDFLVAWADGRTIAAGVNPRLEVWAGRIAPDGTRRDADGFLVGTAPGTASLNPAVAAGMDQWLVAWEDWSENVGVTVQQVFGATVSKTASVGLPQVVGSATSKDNSACAPSAAWNGSHFLVAWESPCSQQDMPLSSDIRGDWVAPDGTPSLSTVTISAGGPSEVEVSLGRQDDQVVAVWREIGTPQTGDRVVAARLPDQGANPAAVEIFSDAAMPHLVYAPSVAAVPGALFFTWIDAGNPAGILGARYPSDLSKPIDAALVVTTTTPSIVAKPPSIPDTTGSTVARNPRSTPRAQVAADPHGRGMVLVDAAPAGAAERALWVSASLVPNGVHCDEASDCAGGTCNATSATCCNEACDGLCELCSETGCNLPATADPRCNEGPICGAASSECLSFAEPTDPHACAGFGECVTIDSVAVCPSAQPKPTGSSCSSAACRSGGSCTADGRCDCPTDPVPASRVRSLPGGCQLGGSAPPGGFALVLMALAAIALGWRRARTLLALAALGCGPSTDLEVDLRLNPDVFAVTDSARVVLSRGGAGFAAGMAPTQVQPGLSVSSYDFDGDGASDVVVDLTPDYPFVLDNRFALVPGRLDQPVPVSIYAEVYDPALNRIADIAGTGASVSATLSPNQQVLVPTQLEPQCLASGCGGTVLVDAGGLPAADRIALSGGARALAVGPLVSKGGDVVVGDPDASGSGGLIGAGRIEVRGASSTGISPQPSFVVQGGHAADAIGRSMVVADLDGDGLAELAIGAPGYSDGAGRSTGAVIVLPGRSSWTAIDLATDATAMTVPGSDDQGRFGTALALTALDGKPALAVGAPGAAAGDGAVVLLRASDLQAGSTAAAPRLDAASAGGPGKGAALGDALAADGGTLIAGAPGASGGGAAWVVDAATIAGGAAQKARLWHGEGGRFGAAVGFAHLAAGEAWAMVAAPEDSGGTVFGAPVMALATGDNPLSVAKRSVRGSPPFAGLGAALAALPRGSTDVLVLGAPGDAGSAGHACLVGPATLALLPALQLDGSGKPAAQVYAGAAGGGFGSRLAVADVDLDGTADLVVASGGATATLSVVRHPLR